MLTAPMKRCLDFIASEIDSKGIAPSVREIAKHMGLCSNKRPHALLCALEERGKIRRLPRKARAIEIIAPKRVQYFVFDDESKAFRPWTPSTGNQVKQA